MNESQEVERISAVYGDYQSDKQAQARWNLDNPGNRMAWDSRSSLMQQLLSEHGFSPLSNKRILDIGCGRGTVLAEFLGLGVPSENLFGVDLLEHRIEEAKEAHPDMNFACANAQALEFAAGEFDIVLLFTVFSSILDESMRQDIANEVCRILKPKGAVAIYDFRVNNPKNPNTRAIRKEHLAKLFPSPRFKLDARSTTLLPPLARRLGAATGLLYPALSMIPPLRTHYLSLITQGGT